MTPQQANISIKNVVSESFSLNPSALITLFIIDMGDLGFDMGIISETELQLKKNTQFYFHNNINLTTNSIFWQGNEYIAAPIQATDFEMNIKGNSPVPKLSMTVSDEGIPLMSILKQRLLQFGSDIAGAKVTRIRTYARFLDAVNFVNNTPPQNFYPDPNAELPRDIYYIDRKSNENKNFIEYELASIFDMEGIKLPGRIVSEDNCMFLYRGEGCLYEYSARKDAIHQDGNLPQFAPPVANRLNEKISSLITGASFSDKGEYNLNQIYNRGEYVFIYNRGIKYYFVSSINNNGNIPPFEPEWIQDDCSKKMLGCVLRWQNVNSGTLPFGGFPSTNRFQ
jgi:lambda family phage minor tail protein L